MIDELVQTQPVGVFPLPAGYLVVPPGVDDLRRSLLAGLRPSEVPVEARFVGLALDGQLPEAFAAVDGDDAVARLNRFVLDPTPEALAALDDLDGTLGAHRDLVAFTAGLVDEPSTGDSTPELTALSHAATATVALDRDDVDAAIEGLMTAVELADPVSPLLGAQLRVSLAEAEATGGAPAHRLLGLYREALERLDGTDLPVVRAECYVAAGMLLQEASNGVREALGEAVKHYHAALQLIGPADAPELWATAHSNLASAYLTMPMVEASDQLRFGVAVRSLRASLEVFTREAHPDRWASTTLNLANALVYAPSTHQGDNLVEAVELYDEVLEARDRHTDPLGRARALANQGNALAHLGIFDHAHGRLHEARAIFEEFEDDESVRMIRDLLDGIARHRAAAAGEEA